MANWNLTGEQAERPPRHYLAETIDGEPVVYEGTIKDISDIWKQKRLGSEEEEERIVINVTVVEKKGEIGEVLTEDITIPLFCAFKVSKGSGTYSNSKLYDVLNTAEILEDAGKVAGKSAEEQIAFLKEKLVRRKAKFLVKAVKKGQPDQYSVIDKFTKIWNP